jgi:ribosomal protein S12 methylthiotransferase
VDGYVFIETDAQLMSGDIVSVKIDGATEYDLVGKLN